MTVPVYLFTGFLESGKTTLIKKHCLIRDSILESAHCCSPVKKVWKTTMMIF